MEKSAQKILAPLEELLSCARALSCEKSVDYELVNRGQQLLHDYVVRLKEDDFQQLVFLQNDVKEELKGILDSVLYSYGDKFNNTESSMQEIQSHHFEHAYSGAFVTFRQKKEYLTFTGRFAGIGAHIIDGAAKYTNVSGVGALAHVRVRDSDSCFGARVTGERAMSYAVVYGCASMRYCLITGKDTLAHSIVSGQHAGSHSHIENTALSHAQVKGKHAFSNCTFIEHSGKNMVFSGQYAGSKCFAAESALHGAQFTGAYSGTGIKLANRGVNRHPVFIGKHAGKGVCIDRDVRPGQIYTRSKKNKVRMLW